jgi:hypothetical protein
MSDAQVPETTPTLTRQLAEAMPRGPRMISSVDKGK